MVSPTNALLTALSVGDLLVMVVYIPYAVQLLMQPQPLDQRYSHGWAIYTLLRANGTQVGRSGSQCGMQVG